MPSDDSRAQGRTAWTLLVVPRCPLGQRARTALLQHLTQHTVTWEGDLAAVHALHTADHAKHVANIAAAAFTAIAGVEASRSSTGRGCR
jgi:hypothetical protein